MVEVWNVLFPILIVDVINPVLLAFMVYAAGTKYPVSNSSAVLIGHTVAYFGAGFILALGLEQISDRLVNPQFIDYIISFLIGIILIWILLRPQNKKEGNQSNLDESFTPIKAFCLGATVNFIGIPFALPYFAALNQILKANLTVFDSVITLFVYNLFYALPFVIVPALVVTSGERSQSLLKRINKIVERGSSYIMPALLAITGFALVGDAVKYFLTGNGLF
ncbi:GAP family protein [Parahaliea sp. F7430]|uniref:GAP family protein n=1 Tax=Sediminihaliea albiluteola TaxID=2758564 RepID=A0A7W2TWU8_9GAMM|nr:GAP family protein [Sediminihaliea albiluteola]MBA6413394.1 GAP family protein [Sediminihaliea albiluteola]